MCINIWIICWWFDLKQSIK